MEEMEVIIDTEEIAEFFYHELIKRGFTPSDEGLHLVIRKFWN